MKEDFVKIFIESCAISGLCTSEGSSVTFLQNPSLEVAKKVEEDVVLNDEATELDTSEQIESQEPIPKIDTGQQPIHNFNTQKQGKSNINVNIDVDPSMDPEKLEKLLKLLKNYGAI